MSKRTKTYHYVGIIWRSCREPSARTRALRRPSDLAWRHSQIWTARKKKLIYLRFVIFFSRCGKKWTLSYTKWVGVFFVEGIRTWICSYTGNYLINHRVLFCLVIFENLDAIWRFRQKLLHVVSAVIFIISTFLKLVSETHDFR